MQPTQPCISFSSLPSLILLHYDSLLLSVIVVIIVMFDFVNRYVLLQSPLASLEIIRVAHKISDVPSGGLVHGAIRKLFGFLSLGATTLLSLI